MTYAPRFVSSLGAYRFRTLRAKLYGICHEQRVPRVELISAMVGIAERVVSAHPPPPPALGFAVVHEGSAGCYVLVDWWENDNELAHHLFVAEQGAASPRDFAEAQPGRPLACVWELAVIDHERRAWIETVIGEQDDPETGRRYLEATLAGPV